MILRCTARLLQLLRLSAEGGAPPEGNDWYANVVWVSGRKCILVAHAQTMFCAFAADIRVADLRPLGRYVVNLITHELEAEGLAADRLGPLDPDALVVAKTADRRVLGNMNDFAFLAEFTVEQAGGLTRCDIAGLNRDLRRTLFGRGGKYTSCATLLSLPR